MKKLILVSATALLSCSAAVNAQNDNLTAQNDIAVVGSNSPSEKIVNSNEAVRTKRLDRSRVSYQSQQQFYTDFGAIPGAVWERDGLFDKVIFNENGVTKKAFYDMDGSLVGTIVDKSFSDLPANAQRYIDKKYAGYAKGDVVFFDDNELNSTDMILYGDSFEDEDNYFIELSRDNKDIVLEVNMNGNVKYFKDISSK